MNHRATDGCVQFVQLGYSQYNILLFSLKKCLFSQFCVVLCNFLVTLTFLLILLGRVSNVFANFVGNTSFSVIKLIFAQPLVIQKNILVNACGTLPKSTLKMHTNILIVLLQFCHDIQCVYTYLQYFVHPFVPFAKIGIYFLAAQSSSRSLVVRPLIRPQRFVKR